MRQRLTRRDARRRAHGGRRRRRRVTRRGWLGGGGRARSAEAYGMRSQGPQRCGVEPLPHALAGAPRLTQHLRAFGLELDVTPPFATALGGWVAHPRRDE